jgi:hypothetical protein
VDTAMAVHVLTVRVVSDGQVLAVRQRPFLVLADGEDPDQGAQELWRMAEVLDGQAEDIEAARHDPGHHKHHWWLP